MPRETSGMVISAASLFTPISAAKFFIIKVKQKTYYWDLSQVNAAKI
jgi:hypothetical protein